MDKPTYKELRSRIDVDLQHFGGILPERNAIAWRAYLTALLEWQLMPLDAFKALADMLPLVDDDPVIAIMLGRGNYQD